MIAGSNTIRGLFRYIHKLISGTCFGSEAQLADGLTVSATRRLCIRNFEITARHYSSIYMYIQIKKGTPDIIPRPTSKKSVPFNDNISINTK